MAKTIANTKPKTPQSKLPIGPGFIEKNAFKISLFLMAIALLLRLYRLGFLSLWVDEYMHALAAANGHFKHGENNGILLTWLNTTFAFVLGNTEFSMRFPVALFGALLVPVTYVLGKRLVNYRVGLMSAVLVTCSLYLIFWSRVDRPYGMVATMYLPVILCFWLTLEQANTKEGFWKNIGIHPKYLGFTLLALLLAMLSQLICFLFLFTAGFYGSLVAIDSWLSKASHPFKLNAYNVLFYLNVVAVVLMLTPMGNNLMRPIIELFLPGNMANLILPNLKAAIAAIDGEQLYKSFDVYQGVLTYDFKLVYGLGLMGIVFAFISNRKLAYLFISSFIVPFLLMSFVFREPVHAKYLSYIYPLYLISAAYAMHFIAFNLMKYISKGMNDTSKSYLSTCTVVFVVLVFGISKRAEIASLLKTETHGDVVDKHISEIHFVNWKQPCFFIKDHKQAADVIMATVQQAPRFYLGLDSVVWFRQMHKDNKKGEWVYNTPDARKLSATTYEQLVKTYNENQRGWLLADYYFDNAATDPRAKDFVERNFVFHFDACEDGAVKVFSWDKSKPKTYASSFVIEMGKNPNQLGSMPMSININKAALPPKVSMFFTSQGIDSDMEAFILINDQQVAIKANGKSSEIASNVIEVNSALFKQGENKIQFVYNDAEGNGDIIKGCVIYSMDLR